MFSEKAQSMKKLLRKLSPLVDISLVPLVYPSALLLKKVRNFGVQKLPYSKKTLYRVGIFPITNHYYEPQFDNRMHQNDLSSDRELPGIAWNTEGQLEFLNKLTHANDLADVPLEGTGNDSFFLNNHSFNAGDAELWFQMIRHFKPKKIIEVGSGYSTLMALKAINHNKKENPDHDCELICIEPYEMPWLEKTGVRVIRQKVEDIGTEFFSSLGPNDILFIDSSHVIRPQGDVLFEYLKLLPTLQKDVVVHIHDIFSPKNYPKNWLVDNVLFWNEQYMLESFLTENHKWKILAATNYLKHHHFSKLKKVCPFLREQSEPGSFYIQRIS